MGGINCGASNGRTTLNSSYRLKYASYSKYLFKTLEMFYHVNSLVEEFTLLEQSDSDKAMEAYQSVLVNIQNTVDLLGHAKKYLIECYDEIYPLFKYNRLKEGSINQYKKLDISSFKHILESEGMATSETDVWSSVTHSLQSGGEVDYLIYQQQNLDSLEDILSNLLEEYQNLEKDVRLGTSYIAIRDIDVKVTPYTAMALTKINELTSSLVYLCLVEFSAHTSISGKQLDIEDLLPNANKGESLLSRKAK